MSGEFDDLFPGGSAPRTGEFDDLFEATPTARDGGEFDDLFDSADNQGGQRDPLTAGSFGEGANIAWQNGRDNAGRMFRNAPEPVKVVLGTAAKALQPLAAPQQIIFGGIRATQDLFDGDDETSAWETMKRGGRSALSFLTWGGYQAAGLHQGDPRAQAITGYEMFKKAGAPQWVARWGGTAADFLLDVPLIGQLGKVSKLDGLTAGMRIGENMAQSFDSPAALRAFAGGVVAAPFTTQPIKRVVEAVPAGIRQQGKERLVDPLLNHRTAPARGTGAWAGEAAESVPVKPTAGQFWISRTMGVPDEVAGALDQKTAVMSKYAVLHNEALQAFDVAKRGLDFKASKELDTLIGRLADESIPAARVHLEGQIQALETRTGRTGLYDDAMKAVNRGIQFDVFSAEKLTATGLMSPEQLKKYQAGDKRHVRRVLAMYGEDQQSHLRRLLDRDAPASVGFDAQKLEGLYDAAVQRGVAMPTGLPSGPDFARAVQAAYTDPAKHPADFLRDFFSSNGMTQQHVSDVLDSIGKDWAQEAGIHWRPSDAEVVRHVTARNAEGGASSGAGPRNTTAVTAQRQEISDMYADVLGEIEAFTKRITEQHRVTSQAVTVNGVVQDIRKYLTDNDLIETVQEASGPTMRGLHTTAGLRVVSEGQARALGNGFTGGEIIPAEIHRILLEQVNPRKDSPLGLAWQWFGSRWTGKNLANPSSINTNLTSAFVMADQAGHSIPGLVTGIYDYLRLHRAAVKGDGALDTATAVNGVTMKELFDQGAFTHNTLMNREVVQQSNRLMDELANPAGSPLQQKVAAMQEWLTETERGAKVAGAYQRNWAVKGARWLGDTYGRVDSMMKGGLYMSLRKQGMVPEKAARVADETFFNYENVPYVVDGLRRWGLLGIPYASFKFLAAGRFMRSLYQNPYGVHKYYRLDNSSKAAMQDEEGEPDNGKSALQEYQEGSPDYVRNGLYLPAGVDSEGRRMAVRLDALLPETAIFDSFNADGVAGTLPPAVQWAAQLVTGKGYQGRDVYRTGETLPDTWRLDKREAVRGAVKHLWQFGAYPYMPGQPMTERIVKAVADSAVPVETISNPVAQNVLKILSEGPTGVPLPGVGPLDQAPWAPEKRGSQPVPDVEWALGRALGVKAYPVTTTTAQPGSARSNMQGLEAEMRVVDKMANDRMRSALNDEQRQEVRRWVDGKRDEILRRYGKR